MSEGIPIDPVLPADLRRGRWRKRMTWALMALAALFVVSWIVTIILARGARERFPPLGSYVEVEGLRLHYVERGAGNGGPPIVLLHGAFGALQDWDATILDDLAKSHRVIALDRPGHGYSDRPDEVATPAVQARIVQEFLTAMEVEHPVLVGFSWGGAVGITHALEYPGEASAVVVISAPLYDWKTYTSPAYKVGGVPLLGPLLANTVATPLARLLASASVENAFEPHPVPPAFANSPIPLALTPQGYLANSEDMAILQGSLAEREDRYPELTIPVVIVVGEEDQVAKPRVHSHRLHAELPASTLVSIEDGGHQLLYSHPERVLAAIELAVEYADAD